MSDVSNLDNTERMMGQAECLGKLISSYCSPEGDKCQILGKCTLPSATRVTELVSAWQLFDGTVPHTKDFNTNALITSGFLIQGTLQTLAKINDPILPEQRLVVGFINHFLSRDLLVISKDKQGVVNTKIVIGGANLTQVDQRWFAEQLEGQVRLVVENTAGRPVGQIMLYPEYAGVEEKRHNWSYGNSSDKVFEKAGVPVLRLTYTQPELNFRLHLQGIEFVSAADSRKHFSVIGSIWPKRQY